MGLEDHLDKLKTFKVIAETKKLGEAAKRVRLTQPSLSRLIDTLEEALGVQLFYRGRSGTFLTPSGEQLLVYTNQILAPLKDLEARIKSGDDDKSGHLRVGSYETLSEYLWPDFLSSLKKKNKNLVVSIRTTQSQVHVKALESGEIDLLVDAEPRIRGDYNSYPLYSDSFAFYVSKKLSDDVLSCPIIYVPNVCDENELSLESHIFSTDLINNNKMELDSFTAARTFCEKGLGVAVLPTRLAQSSVKKNMISQINLKKHGLKPFGKHTIFATISAARQQDKRIKYLVNELKYWLKK